MNVQIHQRETGTPFHEWVVGEACSAERQTTLDRALSRLLAGLLRLVPSLNVYWELIQT